MGNKDALEYYKFIRNTVQFIDVELVESNCKRKYIELKEHNDIELNFTREVELEETGKLSQVYLTTHLKGPEELFDIQVKFKGVCEKIDLSIENAEFAKYSHDQIVPLLLPYAREFISNTLVRMQLPIFLLPTMDILKSLEANDAED